MAMDTNIYLDIDGVLIANELNPANYARDFIHYVLKNYPSSTYWLTTHCQGDAAAPLRHIGHLFDASTLELLKMIKPTTWGQASKATAIDFSRPFLWFDDDLFHDERETLIKHDVLDNWIEVNLAKDENQLHKFITSFPIPVNTLKAAHNE